MRAHRWHAIGDTRGMIDARLPDPAPRLTACVVVPARDEAHGIAATLQALCRQCDLAGGLLDPATYEVLLLANNCQDATARVARQFGAGQPHVRLHVLEETFPPERANIGHARRWLMELAVARLGGAANPRGVIASTDADTIVAPDWLATHCGEVAGGADAVGGRIIVGEAPGSELDPLLRRYHLRDVAFQHLVAELEARLDPVPWDPWPRHHQHFGANMAVTVGAYQRAGGIPAVHTLEDMAFFEALRRCDARIRHSPRARVHTSARRDGRVAMGLSTQLGEWADALSRQRIPVVESAAHAESRIRQRRAWREYWHGLRATPPAPAGSCDWAGLRRETTTFGVFYDLTQAGGPPWELEPVTDAIAGLRWRLADLRRAPAPPFLSDPLQQVEPVTLMPFAVQVA